MRECTNCRQTVPEGATLCPNCGASAPPLPDVGGAPPAPQPLITNLPWLDMTLGVLTALASLMVFGIGSILALVLYFTIRGRYPVYARGVGIGLAVLGVLALGVFGLCVYGLTASGGIH